jgi:hypothetical protein
MKPALGQDRRFELVSSAVSGTYAEPGTGTFRTERAGLTFECRYCGLEITLEESGRGATWRHQATGDEKCESLSQVAS